MTGVQTCALPICNLDPLPFGLCVVSATGSCVAGCVVGLRQMSVPRFSARASVIATVGLVLTGSFATFDAADARSRRHRQHVRHHQVYTPPYAAYVVDANTGKVLHAHNENELRHPASVTKVMTLYMLFEQLEKGRVRLDGDIRISAHAASMAPSKLGLRPGSTIEVEDAILALVTKSAKIGRAHV